MLPHKHVLISAAVGAVGWWGTGTPAAGLAALATGVLPDLDHLIDYSYYYWRGDHRIILPLHGYEYAVCGAIVALRNSDQILGVAVFSYLVHLLADQAENRTKLWGYSLSFRLWQRFRLDHISTVPEAAVRGRDDDLAMLKGLLQRWRKHLERGEESGLGDG
ncbi:MAG: hypothetical protein R3C14_51695 [Caldilineaceae bacterium]